MSDLTRDEIMARRSTAQMIYGDASRSCVEQGDAYLDMALCDMALRTERAEAELAAKQAHTDRLVLEFCPEEMTEEQTAEWASHQRAASAAPGEGT